ncbi:hypothetical protein [Bradyrhizobium sp. AZCC 1693]
MRLACDAFRDNLSSPGVDVGAPDVAITSSR